MKRTLLAALIFLTTALTSCDKLPENGRLDGMWQLMSIQYHNTAEGDSLVSTQDRRIYWSVQLGLISIRSTTDYFHTNGIEAEVLSRFTRTTDSLHLTEIYTNHRTTDSLLTDPSTTLLRPTGIDGNKASFAIEHLTPSTLHLQSPYARLNFRKF